MKEEEFWQNDNLVLHELNLTLLELQRCQELKLYNFE
jgi:hypothetical protein